MKLEAKKYIALLLTTNIGISQEKIYPLSFKQWHKIYDILCQQTGSIQNIFSLNLKQLAGYFSAKQANTIFNLCEREIGSPLLKWHDMGIKIVGEGDFNYPSNLCYLNEKTPPLLFLKGDMSLLNQQNNLSIVGTRNADQPALDFCIKLVNSTLKKRICIVSGAANGIDITAQTQALSQQASSIFILPYGIDTLAAKKLEQKLKGNYLFISAYPPDALFNSERAYQRNRMIYSFSNQTVVVSAHLHKGGSWAGAAEALLTGSRHVFIRKCSHSANLALKNLGAHWLKTPNIDEILEISR